jgi:enamine deaminase RidA (YjgF/YER057c/UK114 family)
MRISEPKPHWINYLLVSFDSEVRQEVAAKCCELRNRDTSAFGPPPYPARTTCVVAGLPDPKMLIEIEGVASLAGR